MMGTEEEVSKMGGMWERRNANAPVCGDKSRGSCWRRRLSGLCPKWAELSIETNFFCYDASTSHLAWGTMLIAYSL